MRVWPLPWAPSGLRGGVVASHGPIRALWGRGCFPGPRLVAAGYGRSLGPSLAAVGAWLLPWGPSGRRGGVAAKLGPVLPPWKVAAPLVPVWPPWGCGRSPWPRLVAVVVSPISLAPPRRRGTWPVRWAPSARRRTVTGPQGSVWQPWGRGRAAGPCLDAVGAWPVPRDLLGCRGGVAGPLGPVYRPWGNGRFPGHHLATWRREQSPKPRLDAVGMWRSLMPRLTAVWA